jgi:hypothetical protein
VWAYARAKTVYSERTKTIKSLSRSKSVASARRNKTIYANSAKFVEKRRNI